MKERTATSPCRLHFNHNDRTKNHILLVTVTVLLLSFACFISPCGAERGVYDFTRQQPRRRIRTRRRRRRLQGNDKQDKNATPPPTPAPTLSPTPLPTLRPTVQVTQDPTAPPPTLTPTMRPTTAAPATVAPTILPTLAPTTASPTFAPLPGSIGSLVLKLSVVHVPESNNDGGEDDQNNAIPIATTASDVMEGRAPVLSQAVLSSLLVLLCVEVNVVVVENFNSLENSCIEQRLRFIQEEEKEEEMSIVVSTARLQVMDGTNHQVSEEKLQWTEWTVTYPVLKVGDIYLQTALQNSNNANDEEALKQEALLIFQSVARLALSMDIQTGSLHQDWPVPYRSSLTGLEEETYGSSIPQDEEVEEDDDDDEVLVGYTEPLDPAPLHALRVAGIIMMITTLTLGFFLMKIAEHRRKEREWDDEYKERGRGGLVTEEGLDYMLEVGRRESMRVISEGDITMDRSIGAEGSLNEESSVPTAVAPMACLLDTAGNAAVDAEEEEEDDPLAAFINDPCGSVTEYTGKQD